jgi:hypothetical protein
MLFEIEKYIKQQPDNNSKQKIPEITPSTPMVFVDK